VAAPPLPPEEVPPAPPTDSLPDLPQPATIARPVIKPIIAVRMKLSS
jgi:hypothetical protein